MNRAFERPGPQLSADFEERFANTWLAGMAKAGIEFISKTEGVGRQGAETMFWAAVARAQASQMRKEAEHAFELDRELAAAESTEIDRLDEETDWPGLAQDGAPRLDDRYAANPVTY